MLEISEKVERGVAVVQPAGKIDTMTAKGFETHLAAHVTGDNGPLLVDMQLVDYVSSFGLRSLLIIAKQMAPLGRKFVLFGANPSVVEVLRVSGFLRIIDVVADAEEAFSKVGADAA